MHSLLLPHKYKNVGWFIFIPALIASILLIAINKEMPWLNVKTFALVNKEIFGKYEFAKMVQVNVTGTIVGSLFLTGAMLIGFSKEKVEDEFIGKLRLSALLWAVCVNYLLLLVSFLTIYGVAFFSVMIYNMFTVLLLFIARFHYLLLRYAKGGGQ